MDACVSQGGSASQLVSVEQSFQGKRRDSARLLCRTERGREREGLSIERIANRTGHASALRKLGQDGL